MVPSSMGQAGSALLDNVLAESFVATFEMEFVYRHCFRRPRRRGRLSIEYLEGFYNRRWLHSSLGYKSPAVYEEEVTMEGVAVA